MKYVLLVPIYGKNSKEASKALKAMLVKDVRNLEVEIKNLKLVESVNNFKFPEIELFGEDSEAAGNYLCWIHGSLKSFLDLRENELRKGQLKSVGSVGFGLYLDVGVIDQSRIEALIPLFKLRKQLADNKKVSIRKIIKAYGLIDNFPLQIKLTKIDQELRQIEAELSQEQIDLFKKWMKDKVDRLIVCGATRQRARKAVIRSGHLRDILAIERLGLLEHAIVCKYDTSASGLISEIGALIGNASLSVFRPSEVRNLLE